MDGFCMIYDVHYGVLDFKFLSSFLRHYFAKENMCLA